MRVVKLYRPCYKDNTFLINTIDVKEEEIYVYFFMDRHYKSLYSFDGKIAMEEAKIVYNNESWYYEIPLSSLKDCGKLPKRYQTIKINEIARFTAKLNRILAL